MKFYLHTAYRDSDGFFSSLDLLLAFQGSVQGNKGAPALWLIISVFLVLLLHCLGHIAWIRSAMSLSLFVATGFLYVNDTNLFAITGTSHQLHASTINAWQGGLHASSGTLNLDKCSWTLIAFGWADGQWYYHTSTTLPGTIMVPVPGGDPAPITWLHPSDAIKVVGVTGTQQKHGHTA
jgi:hypothetical protein